MNINKIKTPYKLRNNRDTASNYSYSGNSTSVSNGGTSWLENYVTYDAENNSLIFVPSISSEGDVTAWSVGTNNSNIWDSLPVASDSVLGAVIIGEGLLIDEFGVLSATATGTGSIQVLDLTSDILSISDGNSVDLSGYNTDLSGYALENWVTSNFAVISHIHPQYSLTTHNHNGVYEPVFSKGTAFNKNFGTTSGTVAQGNHTHNFDNYNGWDLQVNSGTTNRITTGENVNFIQSGATTVSLSGATITISSTDTNTWRGIDDVPVNGQTSESISSNWAYDHSHSTNPHNVTLDQATDAGATTTNSLTVGSLTASGEVTAYSDLRLKKVIKPTESVLDKIQELNIVDYKRIDLKDEKLRTGLIAQELKEVFPQFVIDGELLSINYAELVSVCLKAIQEMRTEIQDLKTQNSN